MAHSYSEQVTKARGGQSLHVSEVGGQGRAVLWRGTTPEGEIGDVIALGILHSGERLLSGQEAHGDLGAGTFHLGTYAINPDGSIGAVIDDDAVAVGLSGAAGATAIPVPGAAVAGAGGQYVALQDQYLCMTNVGTAFATGIAYSGWVSVV